MQIHSLSEEIMEILTPESPRWGEFTERLGGPEGCNFTEDGKFTCDNSNMRPLAVAILARMGEIDINKTLEYFSAHGGHCDCEILFNVDPHDDEDETKDGFMSRGQTATVIMIGDRYFNSIGKGGRVQTAWSLAGAKLFGTGNQQIIDDCLSKIAAKGKKPELKTIGVVNENTFL